jgi:hypothetical protein
MNNKEYWLSMANISELIKEQVDEINSGVKLDEDIFNSIYMVQPYINPKLIKERYSADLNNKVKDVKLDTEHPELFLTAYDIYFGKQYIKSKNTTINLPPLMFSFYALANTKKNITVDMAKILFEEVEKDLFVKYLRNKTFMILSDLVKEKYTMFLIHCLKLNKNLNSDLKLWLELK